MTSRYHPLLVALHWIMALMIFMALAIGGPMLAEMPNDAPGKLTALQGHMMFGAAVGLLLLVRLVTRLLSRRPAHADAGHAVLNSGAKLAHFGLYLLVALMVASGLATALAGDLFAITSGASQAALPADLSIYPPRVAHGILALALLGLILLHLGGVAYHMVMRRDGLMRRMWFGRRSA